MLTAICKSNLYQNVHLSFPAFYTFTPFHSAFKEQVLRKGLASYVINALLRAAFEVDVWVGVFHQDNTRTARTEVSAT